MADGEEREEEEEEEEERGTSVLSITTYDSIIAGYMHE